MSLPLLSQKLRSLSANVKEDMMKQNSDFKNDIVRKLVSQRRMIRKLLKMTDQILECKNEPYELNLEKQQTQAFKQSNLSTKESSESIQTTTSTSNSSILASIGSNKSPHTKLRVKFRFDISSDSPNSGLPPIYKPKSDETYHLPNNELAKNLLDSPASMRNTKNIIEKSILKKIRSQSCSEQKQDLQSEQENGSDQFQKSLIVPLNINTTATQKILKNKIRLQENKSLNQKQNAIHHSQQLIGRSTISTKQLYDKIEIKDQVHGKQSGFKIKLIPISTSTVESTNFQEPFSSHIFQGNLQKSQCSFNSISQILQNRQLNVKINQIFKQNSSLNQSNQQFNTINTIKLKKDSLPIVSLDPLIIMKSPQNNQTIFSPASHEKKVRKLQGIFNQSIMKQNIFKTSTNSRKSSAFQ